MKESKASSLLHENDKIWAYDLRAKEVFLCLYVFLILICLSRECCLPWNFPLADGCKNLHGYGSRLRRRKGAVFKPCFTSCFRFFSKAS